MILKEWLTSNFDRLYNGLVIKDSDMLHIVGTCGNCRHWDKDDSRTKWCKIYESEETCTEWEGDCE